MTVQKRKYLKMFSVLMFGVFLSMIISEVAFSAPPGSKYSIGETLQPECDPGDTNCSVDITSMSIGNAVGSGTANSVLFIDASGDLAQDNSNFTFNDTNNQLLLGDGSVSNPSYSFVNDTDMGFYRQGSTLRYANGGLELLRIGVDGRISVAANASGTVTSNGLFHATYDADTNSQDGIITVDTYSDDGYTTTIGGRRARGTADAPSSVQADDKLVEFIAKGYHSGGSFTPTNRGVLGFYASEDYTSSAQGTYFILKTTREGTSSNHNSLIIDHNGNAGLTYNNGLTSTFPDVWTAGDNTRHFMIQAGNDTDDFGLFARSDSDTEGFDIWNDTSADTVYFDSLVDSASSIFSFRTRGLNATPTTAFTILGSGNIGVGDASPSALFVVGSGDLFQVTSAGVARVPDGSASTPSFSFTGDTDTGIYRSTTNTLGFATGGTSFATLNSSGTFSLTPSSGATISFGETAQAINVGGTRSISSPTQSIKTGVTYQPSSNISLLAAMNNSISVNSSSSSIATLVANRGLIALGSTYSGTVADAIGFQAKAVTVAGGATITANRSFVAESQTVGTSRYAYVGEQSSGSTYWNLYMSGTAQNYLAGSLGIGDSTPDELLDVQRATDGTVAVFQDDDNSCTVDPDLAGVTCTSDERLKTNIKDLEDTLSVIRELRPVRYGFVANPDDNRIGFIAQDIQEYYPEIVSQDNRGYLSMNYALLTPILTKGLQDLDMKFEEFTDLDNTSDDSLVGKIKTFLANTANGIEKIFVKKIFVEQLCIGDTCIDESQLIDLLGNGNVVDPVIIEDTGGDQTPPPDEPVTEDTGGEEIIDDTGDGTDITEDPGTEPEEPVIEEETPPEDPVEEPSDTGTDTPAPDTSGDGGDTGGGEEAPTQ
ncbi:tail fiber domain-containing protein [Candidatus Nomurabacteria bacterium]|nr:tail fiber domain-containing protein [Candidatus Nomurabacteria bacterium]MCB9820863.1 tail fiber domain-containing protein [Candidatus Nomurabacteria bacterium]